MNALKRPVPPTRTDPAAFSADMPDPLDQAPRDPFGGLKWFLTGGLVGFAICALLFL